LSARFGLNTTTAAMLLPIGLVLIVLLIPVMARLVGFV